MNDYKDAAFTEYQLNKRIDELIEICKRFSGEYIPSHHGSGSWATTYSTEFIKASTEIFLILQKLGRRPCLYYLKEMYNKNEIYSCRGSFMNSQRVDYLYEEHIAFQIRHERVQIKKPQEETVACFLCGDLTSDMKQHLSEKHAPSEVFAPEDIR